LDQQSFDDYENKSGVLDSQSFVEAWRSCKHNANSGSKEALV
jgi:hypothetical protein